LLYLQKKEPKSKNKKYVNIHTDEGLNRQEVFLKGKMYLYKLKYVFNFKFVIKVVISVIVKHLDMV